MFKQLDISDRLEAYQDLPQTRAKFSITWVIVYRTNVTIVRIGEIHKNSMLVADFFIEFSVGSEYTTCKCAGLFKTLRFQYKAASYRRSTFQSSSKNNHKLIIRKESTPISRSIVKLLSVNHPPLYFLNNWLLLLHFLISFFNVTIKIYLKPYQTHILTTVSDWLLMIVGRRRKLSMQRWSKQAAKETPVIQYVEWIVLISHSLLSKVQ